MKSFIVSLILLLAVIVTSVIAASTVDEYADRIISAIDEATSASAEDRAYEAKEIAAIWEEAKPIVCTAIHRKDVTRTETLISALSELCERPHTDTEYFGICRQLKEQLRRIREHGTPSWRNIM